MCYPVPFFVCQTGTARWLHLPRTAYWRSRHLLTPSNTVFLLVLLKSIIIWCDKFDSIREWDDMLSRWQAMKRGRCSNVVGGKESEGKGGVQWRLSPCDAVHCFAALSIVSSAVAFLLCNYYVLSTWKIVSNALNCLQSFSKHHTFCLHYRCLQIKVWASGSSGETIHQANRQNGR